jgi:hypothetical protein
MSWIVPRPNFTRKKLACQYYPGKNAEPAGSACWMLLHDDINAGSIVAESD